MFNKKKRYLAVFLVKEQNSYNIDGKKFFNPSESTIEYKGNTYIINSANQTLSKGITLIFYISIDTKKQLLFYKTDKSNEIDTEIVDLVMSKKIIKQLTSELGGIDFKSIILYMIIGLTIGGMFGYIIGSG